jgi:DNA invertase Pin-like site-specific DNA recombinase
MIKTLASRIADRQNNDVKLSYQNVQSQQYPTSPTEQQQQTTRIFNQRLQDVQKSCVIYTRVSTIKQAKDGMSLDAQIEICRDFAIRQGYSLSKVFCDKGISGKSWKNRPALIEALEALNDKTYMLVYSLSRFSRNVTESAELLKLITEKKSKLLSFNENFTGKEDDKNSSFTRWIHLALSEQENNMISQRVSSVMAYRKQVKGVGSNSAPYGWRYRSNLTDELGKLRPLKIKKEQEVIQKIMDYRNTEIKIYSGGNYRQLSYKDIANKLNDEGISPRIKMRSGQPCKWRPQTIANIVSLQLDQCNTLHFAQEDEEMSDSEDENEIKVDPSTFKEIVFFLKMNASTYSIGGVLNKEDINGNIVKKGNPKMYIFYCQSAGQSLDRLKWLLKDGSYYDKVEDGEEINDEMFTIEDDAKLKSLIVKFEIYCKRSCIETTFKDISKITND